MTENVMTETELDDLRGELGQLEGEARRDVAERIKTAREWGDLKENAEYHAAKEEQAHLETRILKLRDRIVTATVVDESAAVAEGIVGLGATIEFVDESTGRSQQFKLASGAQANPKDGTLSYESPVGRALSGHRVGDTVSLQTPSGTRKLRITSIS